MTDKFRQAGVGLLWVLGYILCNIFLRPLLSNWGDIELAIITDVVIAVLAAFEYHKLRVRMQRLEYCTYEVLPAIGRSAMIYMLWFCADILGNIIAVSVPDENLVVQAELQAVNPGAFMLLSILVAPVAEEILLRGVVYVRFKAFGSVWLAAIMSSIIFGVLHGTIAQFFIGTLFGIGQCFLFEYTRNLRWVIGMHIAVNVSNFIIASLEIPVETFVNLPLILFLFIVIIVALFAAYPDSKRKIQAEA